MNTRRYLVARKIVETVADYEAGRLTKPAVDYISGMIKAYSILIGVEDVDEAYARARRDAWVVPARDNMLRALTDTTRNEDPVEHDLGSDVVWQETPAES